MRRWLLPTAALVVLSSACGSAAESPADRFRQNFIASSAEAGESIGLEAHESTCVAEAALETLGQQRLVDVGTSRDGNQTRPLVDAETTLDLAEREEIADAFSSCVPDVYSYLAKAQDSPPDIGSCVIDELRQRGFTVEQILFKQIPQYREAVKWVSLEAQAICQQRLGS